MFLENRIAQCLVFWGLRFNLLRLDRWGRYLMIEAFLQLAKTRHISYADRLLWAADTWKRDSLPHYQIGIVIYPYTPLYAESLVEFASVDMRLFTNIYFIQRLEEFQDEIVPKWVARLSLTDLATVLESLPQDNRCRRHIVDEIDRRPVIDLLGI